MTDFAVNPQTGEVAEFDGQAWKPVDKSRIAKNAQGQVAVFDGNQWKQLGGQAPNKYRQAVEATRGSMSREGGLAMRYGLEGLSTLPGTVIDAANGVANLGIRGVNAVAGTDIPEFIRWDDYRKRALAKLPEPQTAGERVVGDATRMLAAVPGGMGVAKMGEMMGTNALAPMAAAPLQQAVGAVTGGAAYGGAKEVTDSPWLQLAALLAGTAAGSGGTALAENVANRLTSSAASKAPETAQIKAASQASYKTAENIADETGAVIKPDPIRQIAVDWQQFLAKKTYKPELQPNLKVLIDDINNAAQGNITVDGINGIRQVALDIIQKGDPKESMLAGNLIGRIDDMMANFSPNDVLQGDAQGVADAIRKGGALWKTYSKSKLIDDALYAADLKNAASNSGGNLHNKVKQAFTSILLDESKAKAFTAEERAAMEKIVKGSFTQDALRTLGRLAPSSNSQLGPLLTQIGAMGGGGYAAGGLTGAAIGAAVPMVGVGSKALANRSVLNAADALSEMVRRAAIPRQAPPLPQLNGIDRGTLARILMQMSSAPELPGALPLPLRSGPVSVPASDSPGRGSQSRPR